MQIWPPDAGYNKDLENRDAQMQFNLKWGMLPGKIMKHGFITLIEDEYMAKATESKRVFGDRIYVKNLYGYMLNEKGLEMLPWCFELLMVRVMTNVNLKIKQCTRV